jgi:hypothetical protein
MRVKEIIKVMATLVGREDVYEYLTNKISKPDTATLNTLNLLVRSLNLAINELACTYIPMIKKQEFSSPEIVFENLSERILEVKSVKSNAGSSVEYKLLPTNLVASVCNPTIEYSYIPSDYGIDDEIGYSESEVSRRTLAYGGVAEFCLINRAFDEAVMWHKRYMDCVEEICLPKNATIKKRRWV